MGLGEDRFLKADGEDMDGVHGAVAFIEEFKLGAVSLDGVSSAVVVGGGNTAVDAVRELVGLGVSNVTLVYRGQEAGMSGYIHEWSAAKIEAYEAVFRHSPWVMSVMVQDGFEMHFARRVQATD